MGLSLQLLIHLSKLLEQHGAPPDPDHARRLVERVRERFPGLLAGVDPGNLHTSISSAVALALAIDEAHDQDPARDLTMANALEWVLKRQIGTRSPEGFSTVELEALDWARRVLARERQQAEDNEATRLWQPGEPDLAAPVCVPETDPMLLPDVPAEKMAVFKQEHCVGNGSRNRAPSKTDMPWRARRHGNTHEAAQQEVEISPAGPAEAPVERWSLDVIEATPQLGKVEAGARGVEAGGGVKGEPDSLIALDDNSEPEAQEASRGHGMLIDWQVVAWTASSLLLPSLGLLVGGYYMGSGRKGDGVAILGAGVAGWLIHRMALGS